MNKRDEIEGLKKDILRECLAENAIPCLCGVHKIYELEKEYSSIIYSLLI